MNFESKLPYALFNSAIRFNPYQYKPFFKFFDYDDIKKCYYPNKKNLLIGDEVGVGKTIEVGIIIDEFIQYKKNANILIIAPPGICKQWQKELRELFCLNFADIYNEYYFDSSVYPCIIRSISYYWGDSNINEDREWDLLIIDEVHNFRNQKNGFDKISKIKAKNKICLSATAVINEENKDINCIEQILGDCYDITFTTRGEINCGERTKEIQEISVNEKEIPQMDGFNAIQKNLLCDFYYVIKNIEIDTILSDYNYEKEQVDSIDDESSQKEINQVKEIGYSAYKPDKKLKKVKEQLYELFEDTKKYGYGFLIFSHFNCVCDYICEELKKEFINGDRKIKILNLGTKNIIGTDLLRELEAFKQLCINPEPDTKYICICSDKCSEGKNLEFCNVLINYDIPFTPAELQQRIGRIDRGDGGQAYIYNVLMGEGWYDYEIYSKLYQRKNEEAMKYKNKIEDVVPGPVYCVTADDCEKKNKAIVEKISVNNISDEEKIKIYYQERYENQEKDILERFGISLDNINDICKKYIQDRVINLCQVEDNIYKIRFEESVKRKIYKYMIHNPESAQKLKGIFYNYDKFVRNQGYYIQYSELENLNIYKDTIKESIEFTFGICLYKKSKYDYMKENFISIKELQKLLRYVLEEI